MRAILYVTVSMGVRFDKVLEQVARAASARRDDAFLDSRQRKVQRLEEHIRAREATGDRIVMFLGLALTLSAIGLPVYAVYLSEGATQSIGGGGILLSRGPAVSQARQADLQPTTTGSLAKAAEDTDLPRGREGTAAAGNADRGSLFQRYVIHRATTESALIEGPEGLWWVTPGMTLPSIGQVISIERSENGWVVLTSETMITQIKTARASL